MPVGVVKTKTDHKKWKKAKDIVEKQHGEMRWPLVMHIFKQMTKEEDKKDKNISIERAIESQGRKTTIPQEFHEHLLDWWSKNKSSVLTPEQQERLSSIKEAKQRRSKFKVIKSIKELDYLEKKLNVIKSELEVLFKNDDDENSKYPSWKPRNWNPETHPDTVHLIKMFGLHPREAGFLSGVDTSNESSPGRHFKPTALSGGLLEIAKKVAKNKFEQGEAKRKASADPKQNPDLFVQHHAKDVHKGFNGNFEEALKAFKDSPEFQQIPVGQRPIHLMQWKAEWNKNNLENQKQQAQRAADVHSKLALDARNQREKELLEQRKNILMGGGAAPADSREEDSDFDQEDQDMLNDLEER
jgi:hypothetical protein